MDVVLKSISQQKKEKNIPITYQLRLELSYQKHWTCHWHNIIQGRQRTSTTFHDVYQSTSKTISSF